LGERNREVGVEDQVQEDEARREEGMQAEEEGYREEEEEGVMEVEAEEEEEGGAVEGMEVEAEEEEQEEEEIEGVRDEETCCWDESICNCRGDWLVCIFVYLGQGARVEMEEGREEDEIPVIQEEEVIGGVREEELCNGDQSICICGICRGQRGVMSMPTSGLGRALLEIPIVVDRASNYVIEYGIGNRVVGEEEVMGDQIGAVGGGEEEELRGLRDILETGHFGYQISTGNQRQIGRVETLECEEGVIQNGDLGDMGMGSLRQEGAEEEEVEHLSRYEEEEEQGEEAEEEEEGLSDYEEDEEERPGYERYEEEEGEELLGYEIGEGEEELPGYEE
jgi:hypothetical protein